MGALIPVRASGLADLFDCPHRWEGRQILGLGRGVSGGRAHLGTSLHGGTAAFDQARLDRAPISIDDAIGVFVDSLQHPQYNVDYQGERTRDLEAIGTRLMWLYCKDFAPRMRYAAVEMPLGQLALPDLGILLTGTLDRIRLRSDTDQRRGIVDLKSGRRSVDADGRARTAGHAAQLGTYELLAEVSSGAPIERPGQIIGLNATAKQERIGVGQISGARDLLVGTPDSPGLLQHAADILKTGRFYGNPRSQLCSPTYCPRWATCKYR